MRKPFWTDAQIEILRRDYPFKKASDIQIPGITADQICNKASYLKIKKSPEFWETSSGGAPGLRCDNKDSAPKIIKRKINPWEVVPEMPGFLDHLKAMSGCMDAKT